MRLTRCHKYLNILILSWITIGIEKVSMVTAIDTSTSASTTTTDSYLQTKKNSHYLRTASSAATTATATSSNPGRRILNDCPNGFSGTECTIPNDYITITVGEETDVASEILASRLKDYLS